MSTQAATVVFLQGQAWAQAADGSQRELQVGDTIAPDERLITSANTHIQLDFGDGEAISLNGVQEVTMDSDLWPQTASSADEARVFAEEFQTILAALDENEQQLLQAEGDLLEALEAPAAGNAGGDAGGSSFVQLDRIDETVDGLNYHYAPLNLADSQETPKDAGSLNYPPETANLSLSTLEDTPVAGQVIGTDANGQTLSYTLVTAPLNGQVTLDSITGEFIYTPGDNYHGDDSFTVSVSDGQASTLSTTYILVEPVNDLPETQDLALTTPEDTPVSGQVEASDVDGDELLFTLDEGPQHGTVEVMPDGGFTYTPDTDYHGPDEFTVVVDDGQGGIVISTISVDVTPVNDVPEAEDLSLTTPEDTAISSQIIGSDVDGDTLTYTLNSDPENGSVELDPDGGFTYTPDPDYNGPDEFTVLVDDGNGGTTVTTVIITVTPTSPLLLAVDDYISLNEDANITASVAGNDAPGETPSSYSLVRGANNGSLNFNSDGSYTYTPNANFNGSDSFVYRILDSDGQVDTAQVFITVNPVVDLRAADDTLIVDEDSGPTLSTVATNDSTTSGGSLSFVLETNVSHGTLIFSNDGSYTYSPDADFNGSDSFTYRVNDVASGESAVQTVSITVNPVNDPPVANDDAVSTDEDVAIDIDVLVNDTDVDGDPLTVISASAENGTVTINDDGSLHYIPEQDFNGIDTITYEISDGQGGTDTAIVTVTVNPVNDPPVANDDAVSTDEDTPLSASVPAATDIDGTIASYTLMDGVSEGSLTFNDDGSYTFDPNGEFDDLNVNESRDVTFTYLATDNEGGESGIQTVTITVNGLNDAATVSSDEKILTETNEPLTATGTLTSTDVDNPDNAFIPHTVIGSIGTFSIDVDGNWIFTANSAFDELNVGDSVSEIFDVQSVDGTPSTVSILIEGSNDGPVANADVASTPINTPVLNIDVLANDTDVDADSILTVVDATLDNPAEGSVTVNADSTLSFTPATNVTGPVSITYTVEDEHGASTTGTLTVTVGNNTPPEGADNGVAIEEDSNYSFSADDFGFSDADAGQSLQAVRIDTLPAAGSLTLNGSPVSAGQVIPVADLAGLIYTPAADEYGTDYASFTFSVQDSAGAFDLTPNIFSVDVTPVNDPPVANDDAVSTDEDTPLSASVPAATDIDGTIASYTLMDGVSEGSLTFNDDGSYTFDPNGEFDDLNVNESRDVTFTYLATDNEGGESGIQTVTITVNGLNDAATVSSDEKVLTETNEPLTATGTLTSTDVDNPDNAFIPDTVIGSIGTFSIDVDGNWTFTANSAFDELNVGDSVSEIFDVQSVDGTPSTVSILIEGSNDGPVANADVASTPINTPVLNIDVLANDTDVDADSILTVVDATLDNPAEGSVTVNADSTLSFTPATNVTGPVSITYTVKDEHGASTTGTLTVTVGNNTPPEGVDNGVTIEEDTSYSFSADDFGFSDADAGQSLQAVRIDTLPAAGSLTLNGSPVGAGQAIPVADLADLIYTPAADEYGTDYASFTFSVQDSAGAFDLTPNIFSVDVTPVNDPPVANDDTVSTDEDVAIDIDVLANDTDVDGDPLTVISASAENGTVTINDDGTLHYIPEQDFNGTDTISYEISDGQGGTDTAIVTVTVNAVDDAPQTENHAVVTDEDVTYIFNLNDFPYTHESLPIDSVIIHSVPASGELQWFDGTAWQSVEVGQSIDAGSISAGELRYVPLEDAPEGSHDGEGLGDFTFSVFDGSQASELAVLSVSVNAVADAPDLSLASTNVEIDSNFTLPEGNGLLLERFNNVPTLDQNNATDADILETALSGLTPANTSIVTQVGTGNSAETALDIPTDGAVRVTGLIYLEEGNTYTFSGYNDDTLHLEIGGETVYSLGFNNWGAYTADGFTPAETGYYTLEIYAYNGDNIGDISVLMAVNDGAAQTLDNFTLFVDAQAIVAAEGQFSEYVDNAGDGGYYPVRLNEGLLDTPIQLQDITAALTDVDGSETLTVTLSQLPVGSVLTDGNNSFTATEGNTAVDVTDWDLTFLSLQPPAGFEGQFDLTVNATSTESSNADSATTSTDFTVVVMGSNVTNIPPVAVDDAHASYEVVEGGSLSVSAADGVLPNDRDADHDSLIVAQVATDNTGSNAVTVNGTATIVTALGGSVILHPDGSFSYTPPAALDHSEAPLLTDSFSYRVSDGTTLSNWATVSIGVADTAPVAENDAAEVSFGGSVNGNVITGSGTGDNADALGMDSAEISQVEYGDDIYTAEDLNESGNWVIETSSGQLIINPAGAYTYTSTLSSLPEASEVEDQFTYTLTDSDGSESTASLTVQHDLRPGDDDESTVINEDSDIKVGDFNLLDNTTPVTGAGTVTSVNDITIRASGTDITSNFTITALSTKEGQAAAFTIADDSGKGIADLIITNSGDVIYTNTYNHLFDFLPASGSGSISFDYNVELQGNTISSTATINVTGVNDAPEAKDDSGIIRGGLFAEYWVYKEGVDGPNLESVAQVLDFTNTITSDATFISTGLNYKEGSGDLGVGSNLENWLGNDADTLDYPVIQNSGDAIVRFTGGFWVGEDGTYTFNVRHDDGFIVFVDGKAAFVADFITSPSNFSQTIELTAGSHTVEIYYWDQGGQYVFDGGLFDANGNDLWSGDNLFYSGQGIATIEDQAVTVTVLANDVDVDGDTLSVTDASNGANGTVVVNSNNTITYTPIPGFVGVDSFSYTISDGKGGNSTAKVYIEVLAGNEAPVLNLDADNSSGATDSGYLVTATTEDSVPIVDTDVTLTDTDGDDIIGANFHIENNIPGDTITLAGILPEGMVFSYNEATGMGYLSGLATPAEYETALQLLRFNNGSGDTTERKITITVNDGTVNSEPVTTTIQFAESPQAGLQEQSLFGGANEEALVVEDAPAFAGVSDEPSGDDGENKDTSEGEESDDQVLDTDAPEAVEPEDEGQEDSPLADESSEDEVPEDEASEDGKSGDQVLDTDVPEAVEPEDEVLEDEVLEDEVLEDDPSSDPFGTETFAWELSDGDSADSSITGSVFSLPDGEVLDLADLLQGENEDNLENYLHFEVVNGDTVVHISSHGGYADQYDASQTDQTITLQGVELTGSNAGIINLLLNSDNLLIDH